MLNNLMARRYVFFAISLIIIIPGIIMMAVWGLPISIDFKGGTMLEAQFASGKAPSTDQIVALYQELGIPEARVFSSGADTVVIRSSLISEDLRATLLSKMDAKFNDKVTANRFDNVGPSVAGEATSRAVIAVVAASIVLMAFMTFTFRGVEHAFRYGVVTVVAVIHDVLVMLSVAALGGKFFGWQVDTLFLTAIMTVIAFSAQDTIVVFDRIRENAPILRRLDYEKLVNHSVVQSLTRSINTQIMAVDLLLLALALLGGATLREFALLLLIGMFSGSYSSGFVAAPLLVLWEKKDWKNWFRRNKESTAAA